MSELPDAFHVNRDIEGSNLLGNMFSMRRDRGGYGGYEFLIELAFVTSNRSSSDVTSYSLWR